METKAPSKLTLYVAGQTPKSVAAIANLERICAEHLPGQYVIEVIDLRKDPSSRGSTASWRSRLSSGLCRRRCAS